MRAPTPRLMSVSARGTWEQSFAAFLRAYRNGQRSDNDEAITTSRDPRENLSLKSALLPRSSLFRTSMVTIVNYIALGLVMLAPGALLATAAWWRPEPDAMAAARESERRRATRAIGLQLLIATVAFGLLSHRNPADALASAVFAPLVAPLAGPLVASWLWAHYYPFLAVPVFAAAACATAVSLLWWSAVRGATARAFVLSVATITFVAAFVAVGQVQFRRDVLAAAAADLKPDCLDSRYFIDVLAQALRPMPQPYARAVKDGAVYGWSFRTRSFYSVPAAVSRHVGPLDNKRFASPFPRCAVPAPAAR